MSDLLDDNTVDDETQERIRADIRRLKGKRSLVQVAKEMDIAYGTFTGWMVNSYEGNTSRVANAAQRWVDAQATREETRGYMPQTPGFIDTKTARSVMGSLRVAQYEPDFALIVGGAGIGKTTALKQYREQNRNVFILTGEPCFSTPRMLLDCLAQELELTEKYSSQTVSRAIQRRLRGSVGLLIVDEAQHLSSESLDQLRTIYDLTDVGIALVGNETVYKRLEGHSRQSHFAQLYRRVGLRLRRPKPHAEDIEMFLDAWDIKDKAERRLLTHIGNLPGALGNVSKTLKRAHMMASATETAFGPDLIHRAWENISGTKLVLE